MEYWGKPPEEADEKDLCQYLSYLLRDRELKPGSVNNVNAALRFYEATLNRRLNLKAFPRFRTGFRMHEILTSDEIRQMFDVCENLKHHCALMTLYSSGIRLSELCFLKISDVDSKNMRMFVRQGKMKKDRHVLLSEVNLHILREYYKVYRPKEWLFEGRKAGSQYTTRSVQIMFDNCVKAAGITKDVTVHTMRHCFATHLLEQGIDIFQIKQLMGHSNNKSTAIYLHVANLEILRVTSPLDKLLGGKIDD